MQKRARSITYAFSCMAIIFMIMAQAVVCFATPVIIHDFTGGADDGSQPMFGGLIYDSGTFYGTTRYGGNSNLGTVFSIDINGSNFTLLHEFSGGVSDGNNPTGLVLNSGTLYGVTSLGGDSNKGVLFSMGADGSGFSLLHEFAGGASDGFTPAGKLVVDSGTIYGATQYGGYGSDPSGGTIYSIGTNGSNYDILFVFDDATDGDQPIGGVMLDSGTLYGMTIAGGSAKGTIYSMDTDGTDFTKLHDFAGGVDDGSFPWGYLTPYAGKLYGMTSGGGDINYGTIFSIDPDGTDFTLLHEFAGQPDDGYFVYGSLYVYDNHLFGMTRKGGTYDMGMMFSIDPDGSDFTVYYSFAGGVDDGREPRGDPAVVGDLFYGMTTFGGDSDLGVIFATDHFPELPPGALQILMTLLGGGLAWAKNKFKI